MDGTAPREPLCAAYGFETVLKELPKSPPTPVTPKKIYFEDLPRLTANKLRDLCSERGLSKCGTKLDLIRRMGIHHNNAPWFYVMSVEPDYCPIKRKRASSPTMRPSYRKG